MQSPLLTHRLSFDATNAQAALAAAPAEPAIFALYTADPNDEPYIGRTPNLRSRLTRLLIPSPRQTKRLQLASRITGIAYRPTGSDFESLFTQLTLLEATFGPDAAKRLHLRPPVYIRYHGSNAYPRLSITTRLSPKERHWHFGPFPSRASAENYAEEVLKLFLLRRCQENLAPNPEHPGCVYSEMKKCLAPCYQGCTDLRYSEESSAVYDFLATHGASRLAQIEAQRDQASANLEFEQAANLHLQTQRIQQVAQLASDLVQPADSLRALVLQPSANPDEVSLFLFANCRLHGPVAFSTLGMRIQNEQSGSTSLYAQPMALAPTPEQSTKPARNLLEDRLSTSLTQLEAPATEPANPAHLSLLARWYYRPQAQRRGEILFPDTSGHWPTRPILRAIGRVAAPVSEGDEPLPVAHKHRHHH